MGGLPLAPPPTARELRALGRDTGFPPVQLDKVVRLLDVIDDVAAHPYLYLGERVALTGGTGLAMFVLDAPRLSFDLDLNPDRLRTAFVVYGASAPHDLRPWGQPPPHIRAATLAGNLRHALRADEAKRTRPRSADGYLDELAARAVPTQQMVVQCTNSYLLPLRISSADRVRLFSQVTRGFTTWAAAYEKVDLIRMTPRECTPLEVFNHGVQFERDEDNMKLHTNVVVFSSLGDADEDTIVAGKLAWPVPLRDQVTVCPIRSTKIVFHKGIEYKTNRSGLSCTDAYVTAMHEAGHAFGLGDTESPMDGHYGHWPTVMSQSMYRQLRTDRFGHSHDKGHISVTVSTESDPCWGRGQRPQWSHPR